MVKVVCCRQIVSAGRNNFLDSGAKQNGKGETIRDKFALPVVPEYVTDVTLPAGARVRVGEANPLDGWGSRGGIQIDLMGQRIGIFENPRLLQ